MLVELSLSPSHYSRTGHFHIGALRMVVRLHYQIPAFYETVLSHQLGSRRNSSFVVYVSLSHHVFGGLPFRRCGFASSLLWWWIWNRRRRAHNSCWNLQDESLLWTYRYLICRACLLLLYLSIVCFSHPYRTAPIRKFRNLAAGHFPSIPLILGCFDSLPAIVLSLLSSFVKKEDFIIKSMLLISL